MASHRSTPSASCLFLIILVSHVYFRPISCEFLTLHPITKAVVLRVGDTLRILCKYSSTTGADDGTTSRDLSWLFSSFKNRRRGYRKPRVLYTVSRTVIFRDDDSPTTTLKISSLKPEDAGHYACASHWDSDVALGDQIRLDVFVHDSNRSRCGHGEFRCGSGECLPTKFRCDRFDNCPDKSDEDDCEDPCFDHFQCRNGRCVDARLRCDDTQVDNCGDWSDEAGCHPAESARRRTADDSSSYYIENDRDEVDPELAASRKELRDYRLTLYVAIGCVAGLVFLIVAAFCVVNLAFDEERRAAMATVIAVSGSGGGRRGSGGFGRSGCGVGEGRRESFPGILRVAGTTSGRDESGTSRGEGDSSSSAFLQRRKLNEIMEGFEKDQFLEKEKRRKRKEKKEEEDLRRDSKRLSWVIVDGDDDDDVYEEMLMKRNEVDGEIDEESAKNTIKYANHHLVDEVETSLTVDSHSHPLTLDPSVSAALKRNPKRSPTASTQRKLSEPPDTATKFAIETTTMTTTAAPTSTAAHSPENDDNTGKGNSSTSLEDDVFASSVEPDTPQPVVVVS